MHGVARVKRSDPCYSEQSCFVRILMFNSQDYHGVNSGYALIIMIIDDLDIRVGAMQQCMSTRRPGNRLFRYGWSSWSNHMISSVSNYLDPIIAMFS